MSKEPRETMSRLDADAALDRILALDEDQPVRPGFDTRFFARLEEHKREARRPRAWRRWTIGLATLSAAAAALVMVVLPVGKETPMSPQELALVMDLELLEDYELVRDLEVIEAFETLAQLDEGGAANEVRQ